MIVDDDDLQNKTLTSQTENDHNISDSDSISERSWLLNSIHDISGDNIDGSNSAMPSNKATTSDSETPQAQQSSTHATYASLNKAFTKLSSEDGHIKSTRELCLSKLPTNLSESDIKTYLKARGVNEGDILKITKLVKQNTDLSLLSFISFKIDINESTYKKLIKNEFRPKNCTIKDFIHKNSKVTKKFTVAQPEHFLCKNKPSRKDA